jgi:hypothetical protein
VLINGGKLFTAQQSSIEAQAGFGKAGTIQVQANRIELTDNLLDTSGGTNFSSGGQISLDAKQTTITNSRILSFNGEGTIDIKSPRFHQDAGSVIDAETVTINGVVQP